MNTLARWLSNRSVAWAVVLVVGALSTVSLFLVGSIDQEDNILAFLPRDNPDVKAFYDVNERFGSLDLALVGIEAPDVFVGDFLARLMEVTQELKDTRGMDHVLSLTNVVDFTPDPERGGIVTAPMVQVVPKTVEEQEMLRRRVLSKDHLVGHLVAGDGRAVLVYCFLAYGTDPKNMATTIKEVVTKTFPDHRKYWGGGPFISTYIYNSTQKDIRRLTPWAVLAIVLILMVTFRDIIGVCLVLLSTALGIVISLGLMSLFNISFNIVLGSMPVILFAIGSAYGIHMLARYYTLAHKHDREIALMRTVTWVGPTVLAAGLTTAAGLLSFVLMDIPPLRTFGLFTALGILFTLLLSITFIPAVANLSRLSRKQTTSAFLRRCMARLTVFAQSHRLMVGAILMVVALAGASLISQVDTRMDMKTFFAEDSPPDRAEKFLNQHFGGSQFIQIHAKGDMGDPHVLRELRRVADEISLLSHVTNVLHVSLAVAQSNDAMVGQRRVPDTPAQVKLQYSFLASDPSVAQLVTRDQRQALIHIKVDSSRAAVLEGLLEEVEDIAAQAIDRFRVVEVRDPKARARLHGIIAQRIEALGWSFGIKMDPEQKRRLTAHLGDPAPGVDPAKAAKELARFLRSEECAVNLGAIDPLLYEKVAAALAALGPGVPEEDLTRTLAKAVNREPTDIMVEDLVISVGTPLEETFKFQRAAGFAEQLIGKLGTTVPADDRGRRFMNAVTTALLDLENPTVMLPDPAGSGTLALRVTGLPVMHRGLSTSTTANQLRSLVFALIMVVLIMTVLFRSFFSGLMVASPTLLTLLVIYGGMGLLHVHLDIGTALLASLILGAGVDYAVHLASAWQAKDRETLGTAAARAADSTGPAIWTNAVMVCVGFFVLTLGEAKPLKNVGGLTAVAMVVAALVTFLAIPVMARKRRYRQDQHANEVPEASEVVEAVLGKSALGGKS